MTTTLYPQSPIQAIGPFDGYTILAAGTPVPDGEVARIVGLAAATGTIVSVGAPAAGSPTPVGVITVSGVGPPASTAYPSGTVATDVNGGTWVLTGGVWQAPSSATSVRSYSTTVGDGANTSFAVTHGLGETALTVSVLDSLTGEYVYPTVSTDPTNKLLISFAAAPAVAQYQVTVMG